MIREGETMNDDVEPMPLCFDCRGEIVDIGLLLDIAWTEHFGAKLFA